MTHMRRSGPLLALVLASALASGCRDGASLGADKAGGTAARPITLQMRDATSSDLANGAPPVADFVRLVEAFSHGTIRVRVLEGWGDHEPNSEADVVRSVAAGGFDLAWTGSRVFDSLGVTSFEALSAPMLIDSYALEAAVLGSSMPSQMLAALTRVHVSGVAMLGDGLRLPIGVRRALLRPADWRRISFGTFGSHAQEQAIRALGAVPVVVSGIDRLHALDAGALQGFELDLHRYTWLGLPPRAHFVATNVVLWPEFDVVIANPQRLAELSREQRAWLREAADQAARDSVRLTSRGTAGAIRAACAQGARFVVATPAELAVMRRSFASVYRRLERDRQTRSFIGRIEALRRAIRSAFSPPIPVGCTSRP
jgi:TRAP-type C4-dicarboxylate transport system substrate-binding protein